jgi:hypothetical protein
MMGRIVKWKGYGRKLSWPNLKHFLGGSEENQVTPSE